MTLNLLSTKPLQLTIARIACDLHIFQLLAQNDGSSMDVESLARSTKADEVLLRKSVSITCQWLLIWIDGLIINLGRILVYLAATGMVAEPAEDSFVANNITKALAIPGYEAGIYHKSACLLIP